MTMSGAADAFMASLDRRVDAIVDACTRCGKCAAVCPITEIPPTSTGFSPPYTLEI